MNAVYSMLGWPLTEALGWALFHSLWQGALVAATLGVFLISVRSARVRYIGSCLALLAMLLVFIATAAHCLRIDAEQIDHVKQQALTPWEHLPQLGGDSRFDELAALIPWLAPLWLAGVSLAYIRSAAAWLTTIRVRKQGVFSAPAVWQERLEELGKRLHVSRPVRLMESILADTPMVAGHVRPVILVPLGFLTGLAPEHVEAILLHEMAHVRRSDYLVNLLQKLIEGLFFYHPAVWWISHVIRTEREHCCDDVVVDVRGDANGYATALTLLEQNRLEQTAMAATGGNLMRRVKRLLYPKGPGTIWAPALAAVILIASSAMVSSAWRQVTNNWQKWLNEDVVYIINNDEKAAFEQLKSDPERKHFVDQFWERRNPTPGSANNTFKEEHYRRIAYANNHWASHQPGWKTDRGHMYIKYGPPDEIDSHPKGDGAAKPYPFEDWTYNKIDGVGTNVMMEFADADRLGEMRMTLDPNTSDPNAKVVKE